MCDKNLNRAESESACPKSKVNEVNKQKEKEHRDGMKSVYRWTALLYLMCKRERQQKGGGAVSTRQGVSSVPLGPGPPKRWLETSCGDTL